MHPKVEYQNLILMNFRVGETVVQNIPYRSKVRRDIVRRSKS